MWSDLHLHLVKDCESQREFTIPFLLVQVFVRASIARLLEMSICGRSDARACFISVKGVVIGIVAHLTMHHTKQSGDVEKSRFAKGYDVRASQRRL
jgi:hypothetical protein